MIPKFVYKHSQQATLQSLTGLLATFSFMCTTMEEAAELYDALNTLKTTDGTDLRNIVLYLAEFDSLNIARYIQLRNIVRYLAEFDSLNIARYIQRLELDPAEFGLWSQFRARRAAQRQHSMLKLVQLKLNELKASYEAQLQAMVPHSYIANPTEYLH